MDFHLTQENIIIFFIYLYAGLPNWLGRYRTLFLKKLEGKALRCNEIFQLKKMIFN